MWKPFHTSCFPGKKGNLIQPSFFSLGNYKSIMHLVRSTSVLYKVRTQLSGYQLEVRHSFKFSILMNPYVTMTNSSSCGIHFMILFHFSSHIKIDLENKKLHLHGSSLHLLSVGYNRILKCCWRALAKFRFPFLIGWSMIKEKHIWGKKNLA